MENNFNKFDIDKQFDAYLNLIKLKKEDMPTVQYNETKRAFFGAWGQLLMLLRNDLAELDENKAINKLESMNAQVLNYFITEEMKQNMGTKPNTHPSNFYQEGNSL